MDAGLTASGTEEAKTSAHSATVNWTNIVLFVVFAFVISWGIWMGLRAVGVAFTIRSSLGMFGPALACLLVRLIRREGFRDAGLRLAGKGRRGVWRMYLAAYLAMPILIAASIGLVLLVGYQHWALSEHIQTLARLTTKTLNGRLPVGFTAEQLVVTGLITQTVLGFTLGIVFNMIFTFGEEFGWRGYLLPKLAPLGGIAAAIITGVVWGVWHAPLIVQDGYNYPGYPWLGVVMMTLFTVSLGMIFAWLRFRSGSVWPSTLAHAALNAQAGFAALVLSQGDSLFSAPIGLIGLLPMIAFAIWLVATGRLRAQADTVPDAAAPATAV